MSHPYAWTVHYRDGSALGQINAEGVDDGSWRKVDVRNVAVIRLEPTRPGLPLHGVIVPEGAIAFLTFKRGHALDPNTGDVTPHAEMLAAGWERNGSGSYVWIDEQGNTALCASREELA